MKFSELKQKIKGNVTKERVVAAAGVAFGIAGVVLSEYYRRNREVYHPVPYDRNGPDSDWTCINVPKECIGKMLDDGAVMKVRMKMKGETKSTQITMKDGFDDFDNYPGNE